VQQDIEEGPRAGVTGTPAFFNNGWLLSGAQPLERVVQIIEDELAQAQIKALVAPLSAILFFPDDLVQAAPNTEPKRRQV
jgi:protein-disulfide isomerase